jgi:CBS domain-containing protein
MKAKEIMTQPVRVVPEDCSLEAAALLMLENGMGCLPIVDARGKLVGILTESDFAGQEKGIPFSLYKFPQVFGERMPQEGVEKMFAAARTRKVSEFMHRKVVAIDVEDSVEAAITAMQRTGYHRIPVVADGTPVGIITRHDLLRLMVGRLH